MKILTVNTSALDKDSVTRQLAGSLASGIATRLGASVVHRETLDLPLLNHSLFTAIRAETRTAAQTELAKVSDELVQEVQDASALVIGAPMYNFGVPAALKAWIDLVAQPGKTFRYTANGPEGLLKDKPVYVVVATGGVPVGSAMDFVTPHLRTFFNFLGLSDISFVAAEGVAMDRDASIAKAKAEIEKLLEGVR